MSKKESAAKETEEKAYKIAVNSTKKDTLVSSKTNKKFVKYLKIYANLILLKDKLSLDKLKNVNMLIIGGPRATFNKDEFEIFKNYLTGGGNIMFMVGEGGDERNGTNLNEFLSTYGLKIKGDSVVRTSYYKYLHPKECYIEDSKVHPELLRTIKNIPKKKKIVISDDLLDGDDDKQEEASLKFVYPFGCSIDYEATDKNISILFNSGTISYPANRPLAACVSVGKGKLLVVGSEKFIDDDYFEKEENKKLMDSLIKWQLGLIKTPFEKPSKQVECADYFYIPNIVSLSEKPKSCLEDIKDPPKNFVDLFDMTLFKIDNNLYPEVEELYTKLNLKHETLSIIPPQFETPLPPLQLAVFDPIVKDFPNPMLELFDLDEQFASEKIKLSQITNKCTDEDIDYYIKECSDILGITGKIDNKNDSKAILSFLFKTLVSFKNLNR